MILSSNMRIILNKSVLKPHFCLHYCLSHDAKIMHGATMDFRAAW